MSPGGVAHVFARPGNHDAALGEGSQEYRVDLKLKGYLLRGPRTCSLTNGRVVELNVLARRTEILVKAPRRAALGGREAISLGSVPGPADAARAGRGRRAHGRRREDGSGERGAVFT